MESSIPYIEALLDRYDILVALSNKEINNALQSRSNKIIVHRVTLSNKWGKNQIKYNGKKYYEHHIRHNCSFIKNIQLKDFIIVTNDIQMDLGMDIFHLAPFARISLLSPYKTDIIYDEIYISDYDFITKNKMYRNVKDVMYDGLSGMCIYMKC